MKCERCSKEISDMEGHYIASRNKTICDECMEEYLAIKTLEQKFWEKAGEK